MANYFITNTARFNPFTLNELASYAAQITDRENAFLDEFNNIDDGTLATYLANENPETSAYRRQYDDLMAKLQDASTKINNREYSSDLFRDVKNIRGEYKKLQTPVEAGYKRMASILSEYDKLARSGMPIGENPHNKDLSYFIENPDYAPQYRDAKQLIAMGASAGEAAAVNFDPIYKLSPDGKYYNIQTRRTATPEEIKTDSIYRKSVDDLLRLQGFNPENTDSFTQQARSMIEFGMANSMSDKGLKQQVNPGYNAGGSGGTSKEKEYVYTADGNTRYHKLNDRWVKETKQADNSWSNAEFVTNEELTQLGLKDKKEEKPPKYDTKLIQTGTVDVDTNGKDIFIKAQDIIDNPKDYGISKNEPATVITDEQAQDYMRNTSDTLPWYNDDDKSYVYLKTKSGRVIKLNQREFDELNGKVKPGTIIIPNDPNLKL